MKDLSNFATPRMFTKKPTHRWDEPTGERVAKPLQGFSDCLRESQGRNLTVSNLGL